MTDDTANAPAQLGEPLAGQALCCEGVSQEAEEFVESEEAEEDLEIGSEEDVASEEAEVDENASEDAEEGEVIAVDAPRPGSSTRITPRAASCGIAPRSSTRIELRR